MLDASQISFNNSENLLSNTIFGCLLSSMIFYWINLIFREQKIVSRIARLTSLAGNIELFALLAGRWLFNGYFPLSNLYESLLFLSWIILFIQLILEVKTQSRLIGPLIMPIVVLINGFASLTLPIEMQKASPLVPALQSNWLMMHVSLMMLSYGTLIIGSVLSILYLILDRQYNTSQVKNFWAFQPMAIESSVTLQPSQKRLLENIDLLSYRVISLGFPFLTVGIIAGAVWANEAWGSYWSWDPKETWALITWLTFASYLHARIIKGWEGRKPAWLGTLGFVVVWICYLGVNFLGQGLHSYGWLA